MQKDHQFKMSSLLNLKFKCTLSIQRPMLTSVAILAEKVKSICNTATIHALKSIGDTCSDTLKV